MKNLFVPKPIALVLKKIGFDKSCIAIQVDEVSPIFYGEFHNKHEYYDKGLILYQQVIDWFRENHNIWIQVYNQYVDENVGKYYGYIIKQKDTTKSCTAQSDNYYDTLNKAIEEALKLI